MKKTILLCALFISGALYSFSSNASTPTPAPIFNCNSIVPNVWEGNLSNGITSFWLGINDTGGDPYEDAYVQYNDPEGGHNGASVVGNCTQSGNTVTMTFHSNYVPINFTITMIDPTHATISGQFYFAGIVQASGNVSRY